MDTPLEYILTNCYKADMIAYLESHPGQFNEVVKLAISIHSPLSWRAAWLLWSCMQENDPRIKAFMPQIIEVLPKCKDPQKRELLKILQVMEINEEDEGKIFDICLTIWEGIGRQPSIRYNAFRLIVKISGRHPELGNEVKLLVQDQYMDSLSETVRKAILKMIQGD